MTAQAAPRVLPRRLAWPLVGAVAVVSLLAVFRGPAHSPASDSFGGALVLLLPGLALASAGSVTWARRPASWSGPLLVASGLSWLLGVWNNPAVAWAPAFTLGLIAWALCPPFVAHAVLSFPLGTGTSRVERLFVGCGYANSLVLLGLLPALAFDPGAGGCSQCPGNLLAVANEPAAQEGALRAGLLLGVVWSAAVMGIVVRRVRRSTPALRRVKGPVSAAGVGYLGFVAADWAHQFARPVQGVDLWDRRLMIAQGAALISLAATVAWGWVRAWRTRSDIAQLVVDLADAPPAGGLRDALARKLGDDSLRLAYPLRDGDLVDAQGNVLQDPRPPSVLVRGDRVLAVLTHRPGLLDDPATAEEVARAAAVVLDHERLQAELAAQLTRMRATCQRIVAAGDAERRRLERDLHDGAQQRLVTLLLQVRLLRIGWGDQADPAWIDHARAAERELESAIADLRELARGIFPAVLADEGLAQAVDAFAEGSSIPVVIDALDEELSADGALDRTVGGVAYYVMAESIDRSRARRAAVSMTRAAGALSVLVDLEGVSEAATSDWLVAVQDRVGALDGHLDITGTGTPNLTLRAEIPCGS